MPGCKSKREDRLLDEIRLLWGKGETSRKKQWSPRCSKEGLVCLSRRRGQFGSHNEDCILENFHAAAASVRQADDLIEEFATQHSADRHRGLILTELAALQTDIDKTRIEFRVLEGGMQDLRI